jgi:hypothetical protein
VTGSGLVGTVSPQITKALTGVAASGAVGTVTQSKAVALTGDAAAGDVGTVGLGPRSLALTGVQASGAVGTVVAVNWLLVNNSETSNWALVETD